MRNEEEGAREMRVRRSRELMRERERASKLTREERESKPVIEEGVNKRRRERQQCADSVNRKLTRVSNGGARVQVK